jgi:hypothetical protein
MTDVITVKLTQEQALYLLDKLADEYNGYPSSIWQKLSCTDAPELKKYICNLQAMLALSEALKYQCVADMLRSKLMREGK